MATTRPLTSDEQSRLLLACVNERDRLLILTGLMTGYRVTELLAITWTHLLNPVTGAVRAELTMARRDLKGGRGATTRRRVRSRTVPLHAELRLALTNYHASVAPVEPATAVFASKGRGEGISRVQAHRIIKSAATRAGLDPARIACNSLRRSFCQDLFERSGHNLVLTSRAMNHANIITTSIYLSANEDAVSNLILGAAAPNYHPFQQAEPVLVVPDSTTLVPAGPARAAL